jgi:hypothetical protein
MMCVLNPGVLYMTTETIEKRRQPHEKGIHYPYMELLDKLIEESRQEMFHEKKETSSSPT